MAGRKSKKVTSNYYINNKTRWKVAIYCRLSSDDGDNAESDSITNQRELISQFLKKELDMEIVDYYIDDGYSGTSFMRPDFKRMITDMVNERINTIVVKDLSRFGRNYIGAGRYLEQTFPLYNIRFIAINDNIDSYKEPDSINNVIVPFKNLMNDEYARDISNKVRSILNTKKENGDFIGSYAPYGYIRDPKNVHKFIIDDKASKVVKKIFKMILDGKSKKKIVENLNHYGIPTPVVYKAQELNYKFKITKEMTKWSGKKVDDILKNRTYIGDLEQGKRKRISHKIHKEIELSPEEWTIIPNHHEPIISKEDFERVQDIIYSRDLRVKKDKTYDIFSGHIKCADCGNTLTKRKGKIYDYYCTSYIKQKTCTKHTCQIKKLEDIVLETINKQVQMVFNIDKAIKFITNHSCINYDNEILKNRLDDLNNKRKKYLKLKEDLAEDLVSKTITENEYNEYKEDYNIQINKIKKETDRILSELKQTGTYNCVNKEWINKFENNKQIQELNNKIINELIEDILVSENGNITIKFKYQDEFEEAIKFVKENRNTILAKPVSICC